MTQNDAVIPAAPVAKSILDQFLKAAFVFFAFFFTEKFAVKPVDEVITPDLAIQRSLESREESALKQPNKFESLIGIQNDINIPVFPTHDNDGFPLGTRIR